MLWKLTNINRKAKELEQKKIFIKRENACFWMTKTLQAHDVDAINSECEYIEDRR